MLYKAVEIYICIFKIIKYQKKGESVNMKYESPKMIKVETEAMAECKCLCAIQSGSGSGSC